LLSTSKLNIIGDKNIIYNENFMPKTNIVKQIYLIVIFASINMFYKPDCIHYRGDIPCLPHKERNLHCNSCDMYQKVSHKILIIKLGAMGDVIRTTPLVLRYKKLYPNCKITWLTLTPDILPKNDIHEILSFKLESILYIQETAWDIAINLDKEKEAGALLKRVEAKEKYGYILKDGVITPYNELAYHKFETGMFDDVSKANTLSYPEEIFDICGLTYEGEKNLLENHEDKGYTWNFDKTKKIIGLNTGCGDRWTTRLWSSEKWVGLIKLLQTQNFEVLLLGGKQEDERNIELQKLTGATYLGYFSLQQFINLVYQCDLVVTQVTMAMHITLGLDKKIVLMNNIFNPYEFNVKAENGMIVAPEKACKCFYKGSCIDGVSCMENLSSEKVFEAVLNVISK
jgi:ADP-heptose:LPS heptosyltransferase